MAQQGETTPYEAIDRSFQFNSARPTLPLIEQALAQNPDDPRLLARQASCLLSTGNLDQAKKIVSDALRVSPAHPDLVATAAFIALHEKDFDRTKSLIDLIAPSDYTRQLFQAKSTLLLQLKDPQGALDTVVEGLRKFPGDVSLRRKECQLLLVTSDAKAKEKIEALVSEEPDYWGGHAAHANVQFMNRQPLQALESARTAVACCSESSTAWLTLARYQFALNNLEDAKFSIQAALDLDPLNYAAKMTLGQILEKQGKSEEAGELKSAFLDRLDPVRKRMMTAVDLANQGDFAAAFRQMPEPSEASTQGEKETILNFKILNAKAAKDDEAMNRYVDMAIVEGIQNDTVISAQARRLTKSGDPTSAEALLNKSLTTKPKSSRLLVELAYTHAVNQNDDALWAVYQDLKSLMPLSPHEVALVCEALTVGKHYQDVVDFVELGIKSYPKDKNLLRQRIAAYRLIGEYEHAKSLLKTAPPEVVRSFLERATRPKNKHVRKLPKPIQRILKKLFPKL